MATSNSELSDEDRLPWLETVQEEGDAGPSALRIAALVLVGLALIAAVVFVVYWVQNRSMAPPPGSGQLIRAQEGDYKVKPEQPGGMKVDGEGSAAIATSEGVATGDGAIDLSAVPEAPVAGTPAAQSKPAASASGAVAVPKSGGSLKAAPPVTAPRAASAGGAGGSVVQLGSFPSQSAARTAWSKLSKRFAYLAPLAQEIQTAEVNGDTVYRVRVNAGSADQARALCGKLKVAGEACFIPND